MNAPALSPVSPIVGCTSISCCCADGTGTGRVGSGLYPVRLVCMRLFGFRLIGHNRFNANSIACASPSPLLQPLHSVTTQRMTMLCPLTLRRAVGGLLFLLSDSCSFPFSTFSLRTEVLVQYQYQYQIPSTSFFPQTTPNKKLSFKIFHTTSNHSLLSVFPSPHFHFRFERTTQTLRSSTHASVLACRCGGQRFPLS